jgi:hypothetical protein
MSESQHDEDSVERGAAEEMSGTPLTDTEREASHRPPSQGPAEDEPLTRRRQFRRRRRCTEHLLSYQADQHGRGSTSTGGDEVRMSGEQDHAERAWAADKRDFVADARDDIAAGRDATAAGRDGTADEREKLATDREADLDARERRTEERAAELGIQLRHFAAQQRSRGTEQAAAAAQRQSAREERDQRHAEREAAAEAREAAARRYQASTPATGLAMAFAELARYLYEADNFEDVFARIAETTVSAVTGCEMASITVREGAGIFRTLAFTHPAALTVDQAQYEAREGPCLDAVDTAIVHAPSFPDPRWPDLAGRPVDAGVQAIVSYRLAAPGQIAEDPAAGSLNAYAGTPQAFDDEAREIGLILAAHASVGIQAVHEREVFEQLSRNLHNGLSSRDVIGQAKGILMERLRITPDDAFDTLRRASQQLNIKLREIAERLAETGQLDDPSRK